LDFMLFWTSAVPHRPARGDVLFQVAICLRTDTVSRVLGKGPIRTGDCCMAPSCKRHHAFQPQLVLAFGIDMSLSM
jgi:hypothetical protein